MRPSAPISIDPSAHIPIKQTTATAACSVVDLHLVDVQNAYSEEPRKRSRAHALHGSISSRTAA